MYLPSHFQQTDLDEICRLIEQNGFGMLVSVIDSTPFVTHLPMFLERKGDELTLYGHFAKANPHWQHLENQRSLAIFQGPHGYVSPTWYESAGVPTWNYTAVHLYGEASIVSNEHELTEIIHQLSDQYERERDDPWIPDYPEAMLNAIVGFSFRVDEIQAKYKLSQNKDQQDQLNVRSALEQSHRESDQVLASLIYIKEG